jgi:adenylosuccinate lyase
MTLSSLTAVTPVDGRYYNATKELSDYFSEFALIKYRVLVEVEYFIALAESGIPQLTHFDGSLNDKLRNIYQNLYPGCTMDQGYGESNQSRCESCRIFLKK